MDNKNKETFQDRLLKLVNYLRRINKSKSVKNSATKDNNKD